MARMEARGRFLRSIGLGVLVWACLSLPLTAQVPIFGPDDALLFDYYTADLTTYNVTQFQVQWDGGTWATLGLPTQYTNPETLPGAVTYKVLVPFANGQHTASFRACNAAGCGGGSSPFAFARLSVPGNVPVNVRRGPK